MGNVQFLLKELYNLSNQPSKSISISSWILDSTLSRFTISENGLILSSPNALVLSFGYTPKHSTSASGSATKLPFCLLAFGLADVLPDGGVTLGTEDSP
ncbi:hypothetical protein TRICI_001994 [Trichomonascus ciferrii]|uniref:Uncharacterized protein n=1 Tax=Trichomonascus ciferrii TaxID=44093 RepID=A0A642V837_9ASCO|nr:hypothetical protein TRICI_001994 [Trichomonascus ciferrii]